MAINPTNGNSPLPLAFNAIHKFALIRIHSHAHHDCAQLLAPLLSSLMQRKIGYIAAWALSKGHPVNVTPLSDGYALELLPEYYNCLPKRNFVILTPEHPILEAYKAHLAGGIDIPVSITHNSDCE